MGAHKAPPPGAVTAKTVPPPGAARAGATPPSPHKAGETPPLGHKGAREITPRQADDFDITCCSMITEPAPTLGRDPSLFALTRCTPAIGAEQMLSRGSC